jgi:hypothetical protein
MPRLSSKEWLERKKKRLLKIDIVTICARCRFTVTGPAVGTRQLFEQHDCSGREATAPAAMATAGRADPRSSKWRGEGGL